MSGVLKKRQGKCVEEIATASVVPEISSVPAEECEGQQTAVPAHKPSVGVGGNPATFESPDTTISNSEINIVNGSGSQPPADRLYSRWWLQIGVCGSRIRALYDSGSCRTIMGSIALQIANDYNKVIMPYTGPKFRVADGRSMAWTPVGHVDLPIEIGGEIKTLDVIVIPDMMSECILGTDFKRIFNAVILPREDVLQMLDTGVTVPTEIASLSLEEENSLAAIGLADVTEDEKQQLEAMLDRVLSPPDAPLGCTDWIEHSIEVRSTRPIRQKYYPVSRKIEEHMHSQVREMLAAGIISPSNSEWSSPALMVAKPGGKYRMVIDYRKVNAVSRTSAYPLPNMDQILRRLQNARYISTIDLSSAYHQIKLSEESKQYSAFAVPGMGLFQWNRMPFGLSSAPATFQALADKICATLPGVFAYLDDIIVTSDGDFLDHLQRLEKVLQRITEAGLTINREKSFFCWSEVKYLGVIVNRNGYKPDPDKIAPIMDYPPPKTLRQLRRFLGMTSWYRKFIPQFSTIAEPLTNLTRKTVKFIWGEDQQEAFDQLRMLTATAPVLSRPSYHPDHQFVLQTDASATGLGAVLTQTIDGEERVLGFASRVLNSAERNYSAVERECLAVKWAIVKYRPIIEGYHFKILTDCSSLRWLTNLKNPTGRLARWALELQSYSYDIEYRKGCLNDVPDALSRMYEEEEEVEISVISFQPNSKDGWYLKKFRDVRKNPDKHPTWKITSGNLYHYKPDPWLDQICEDRDAWKLVIPAEKRQQVLAEVHDDLSAGHLGRDKTTARLLQLYFWPAAYKDVADYVRSCEICQQIKTVQRKPAGLMGTRIITEPWSWVCTDICGKLPRSKQGNEYLLLFVDMFTRWCECVPVRAANGKTIAKQFEQKILYRFGRVRVFHSDNGTEFKNSATDACLAKYGIERSMIPAYHAQANMCERVIRTIKTMVKAYAEKDHSNWDLHIYEHMFAYNSAKQDSLGASPAYLNMGRIPQAPNTLRAQAENDEAIQEAKTAVDDWTEHMRLLPCVQEQAAENAKVAHEKQARYYNAKRRDVQYAVGDLVGKMNRILSDAGKSIAAKFAPKYTGPYTVAERLGSNTYALADVHGKPMFEMVAVKDLIPWVEREPAASTTNVARTVSPAEVDDGQWNPDESVRNAADVVVGSPPRARRGRPRKTRVVVSRRSRVIPAPRVRPRDSGRDSAETRTSNVNPHGTKIIVTAPPNKQVTSNPAPRKRGRPRGPTRPSSPANVSPRKTRAGTKLDRTSD